MVEPKPVYVKWVDSTTVTGWVPASELEGDLMKCLQCATLGFLVYEDDDRLTVVASLTFLPDGSLNSMSDPISIPKVSILAWWEIDGVHG